MPRSIKTIGTLGCLVAVVMSVTGCATSRAVETTVIRQVSSPQISYLTGLSLHVRNDLRTPLAATYLLAIDAFNQQTLWQCTRGCGAIAPGETRDVSLVVGRFGTPIADGTRIFVRIVDRATRREYNGRPFVVDVPAVHIPNPTLGIPDEAFGTLPLGWTGVALRAIDGEVTYHTNGRRGEVIETLRNHPLLLDSFYELQTTTEFFALPKPFVALMPTPMLYEGSALPTQFSGIQVVDAHGRFETFTFGDVRTTETHFAGGLYIVEPSRSVPRLTIDVLRYAREAHFDPAGPLMIALTAASTHPAGQRAVFDGFVVDDAENRFVDPSKADAAR